MRYRNGIRTWEITMILNRCRINAVRMYQTLEFLRVSHSSKETYDLRLADVAERACIHRSHIYAARDELVDKGLIKVIELEERGLYRFQFLMM